MGDTAAMFNVPDEVIIYIFSFLEIRDLYSLRKTCTTFSHLTRDRSLWQNLLHRQQLYLPLPRGARLNDPLFHLTSTSLEHLVLITHLSERNWRRPRLPPPKRFESKTDEYILTFELFLDRWLLCVYSEGTIVLWDLDTESVDGRSPGRCRACISLQGPKPWTSAAACLDTNDDAVVVAVTRTEGPTRTYVYRISFTSAPSNEFEELSTIQHPSPQVIRAINPRRNILALSRSSFIDFIDWRTNVCVRSSAQDDDLAELWNGVVALQLCEDHFMCVRTRSIEIYPIPSFSDVPTQNRARDSSAILRPRPVFSRHFTEMTFRGASVSSPQLQTRALKIGSEETSGRTYHISVLTYDVVKGLYNFLIKMAFNSNPAVPPTASIVLQSWSNMTNLPLASLNPSFNLDQSWVTSMPHMSNEITGRTGRGFVTSCAIGPQGKRGVWIERTRGSTQRSVVAFSAYRGSWESDDRGAGEEEHVEEVDLTADESSILAGARDIDGKVVHRVTSYDLREDLTNITFSEVTGKIVLGTRAGHIQILQT